MGEVFLARRADVDFKQQVALKVLRLDTVLDPRLFARERQLLARLRDMTLPDRQRRI